MMETHLERAGAILWESLQRTAPQLSTFNRLQIFSQSIFFVSFNRRIIVEVYDSDRPAERGGTLCEKRFTENGYIFLKFSNREIFHSIDSVLEVITDYCLCSPATDTSDEHEMSNY